MAGIPKTIREYRKMHKRTKSIQWAVKYYNDNYRQTEWDKPSGEYVRKNTDKTRGFRRRNKGLEIGMNNEAPPFLPEGEEKDLEPINV